MSNVPIAEYALLSDCRSAALVSRAGSVDWLCFPRFDGPAVFARLPDEQAGHWSICAAGSFEVSRRYLERTLVLETTFHTPTGSAVLVDAMAIGRNERGHELGANSPGALLRSVSCVSGRVEMEMEYAPRFEYGLIAPQLRPVRESTPHVCSPAAITRYVHDTLKGWRSWSDLHQTYRGPWQELVHHSGRVLQAFLFRPTGAMVAAPTTSLPEFIGGERNWDYRYTWVRDASLTLGALWVAACPMKRLASSTGWLVRWPPSSSRTLDCRSCSESAVSMISASARSAT